MKLPRTFTIVAFVGTALAASMPALADKPATAWREVFQSSPRAGLDEAKFNDLMARIKIPPAIAEKMRPHPATGTVRYRIRVSAAGERVRLRFSNEEGTAPLTLTAASVGLAGKDFDAGAGKLVRVRFAGNQSVTIPVGAPFISDPIDLGVKAGSDLLVSYKVEGPLLLDGNGGNAVAIAPGDQTMTSHMEEATTMTGRPELSAVSVLTDANRKVVVALGDSITDGNRPAIDAMHSWPEELARRLSRYPSKTSYAVVNAGIAGNQVLTKGMGLSALARLDRDALRIAGISHLLVLEGTNDIGMSGHSAFGENPNITPDNLIAGYRQIIARAHEHGVKVFLGTILPFGGSVTHSSPERENLRLAVNGWIRTAREADGVIDFDAAIRDPEKPAQMRKEFDSGDHLHPNEAGSKAMGDVIPLSIFH